MKAKFNIQLSEIQIPERIDILWAKKFRSILRFCNKKYFSFETLEI